MNRFWHHFEWVIFYLFLICCLAVWAVLFIDPTHAFEDLPPLIIRVPLGVLFLVFIATISRFVYKALSDGF